MHVLLSYGNRLLAFLSHRNSSEVVSVFVIVQHASEGLKIQTLICILSVLLSKVISMTDEFQLLLP